MVKYVPDRTGRFFQRPHYEPRELDVLCERMLTEFFRKLKLSVPLPVPTDDLTRLIEQDISDFDGFADLSRYGDDVEGVTEFLPGRKPRVRISAALAEDERRQNRYRTTLTHEFGHVRLHAYLFELDRPRSASAACVNDRVQICKRDTMVSAVQSDWMEWQAGHVCGALLMPLSAVNRLVSSFHQDQRSSEKPMPANKQGIELIATVAAAFEVSLEAAKIRLIRLGHVDQAPGRS